MSPSKSDRQQALSERDNDFFVVGIGASAGGLRPLEDFFENMPVDSGAAFVVIQHLSPDFKSLMKELLGRKTRLEIHRVEDGMELKPNSVYLIPPGKNLVVEGRYLRLQKQRRHQHQPNFPIDLFFESLGRSHAQRAIGVVLSGTGSDGTHGLQAINEAGGVTMVQDPATAEFDGMPESAIATGIVDRVLSPAELAQLIYRFVQSPMIGLNDTAFKSDRQQLVTSNLVLSWDSPKLEKIIQILGEHEQVDFSHYKPSTLSRRIHRRCSLNGFNNLDSYIEHLQESSPERKTLYQDLLIGVTRFFRDPQIWEFLDNSIIPSILENVKSGEELRFWVTACATGEEAYSLAMLLDEAVTDLGKSVKIKIFATDIDRVALEKAASGIYPETLANDISQERLERYFVRKGQSFQVARRLREMLIFAPNDLTKDACFTRMQLITCRNVLIYMQPQLQQHILRNLHFSLVHKGFLVLGEAETVGDFEGEFEQLHKTGKVYQKQRDVRLPLPIKGLDRVSKISRQQLGVKQVKVSPKERMLEASLNMFLGEQKSTCMLVDKNNHMLHLFQDLAKVLAFPSGSPTTDVTKLVTPSLQLPLNTALHRAMREQGPVLYTGIKLNEEDEPRQINLKVAYHQANKMTGDFLMVLIEEDGLPVPAPKSDEFEASSEAQARLMEMEYELQETRENLQATIEELETINEEQQATNEELIASNEELQSTNEELHSVNEELYTVNAEHQAKINQLTELNNDVENLLQTTEIGVIFLDRDLKIRKFTQAATIAINMRTTDISRPLSDLSYKIDCPNLLQLLKEVITHKQAREQEVQLRDGSACMLMRIHPYRQEDGIVDGVVISFVDIGELKRAQEEIYQVNEALQESEHKLRQLNQELEQRVKDRTAALQTTNQELTREINVRKQVENSLRESRQNLYESEERFRATFEQAAVGIAQVAPDGRWLRVNQRLCDIVGYSQAELLQSTFQDITYPEDLEADIECVDKMLAGEIENYSMEKRYICKNSSLVWINLTVSLVRDEDTQEAKYFVAVIQDISVRKQAEVSLKRTSAALQEITERYELAVQGSGDGLWDWDIRNNQAYISPRWKKILGYEDHELEGYPDVFVERLHPDDNQRVRQAIADHLQQLAPFEVECRLQNKTGEYIWIRSRGQAIWDEAGNPVRISGSISDITPLKKIEAALRQANAELITAKENAEAANLAKSDFLAKMTHELRTPLTAILGFTQILNRDPQLSPNQRKCLDTILRSGKHLLSLINEILDISKIEAGMTELHPVSFDLHNCLESLKQMFQVKAEEKGLQLSFEIAQGIPQNAIADESKLRQILINILGNAIKFTNSGSVTLRVTADTKGIEISEPQKFQAGSYNRDRGITAQTSEAQAAANVYRNLRLRFQVEDTGRGIAPEELDRIFDAFVQSRKDRYSPDEGTGLGLTISKRYVELMGGDIHITSNLNQGTTVDFDILVTTSAPQNNQTSIPQGRIRRLAPDEVEHLILIAEDQEENRQLLTQILSPVGFNIIEAVNGREAIELWKKHQPQLIIMDMRMPIMDGYQATRQIKNFPKGQATKIIALTATAFDEDRKLVLAAGCDEFIRKPFEEEVLLEAIAHHLNLKYLYAQRLSDEVSQESDRDSLIPQNLEVMSAQWRHRVHIAAQECSQKTLLRLLADIPEEHHILKEQLFNLVDNFQFDIIANLTKLT